MPPIKKEGLELSEVKDGFIVYDPENERVHYLNATASVIFELCDGKHGEKEIAAFVATTFGLSEPPLADVRQTLEQLTSEGVLLDS